MKRLTKIRIFREGASDAFLFCRAAAVSPDPHLHRRVIRRYRAQTASPWRKLICGRRALLVLAYLRKGETFAKLAAGFRLRCPHRHVQPLCRAKTLRNRVTCCFTLGARADPSRLPVHGPGAGLAGAPGAR